jgi:hypothetical protein
MRHMTQDTRHKTHMVPFNAPAGTHLPPPLCILVQCLKRGHVGTDSIWHRLHYLTPAAEPHCVGMDSQGPTGVMIGNMAECSGGGGHWLSALVIKGEP